jgi:CHAD domain-containing protein
MTTSSRAMRALAGDAIDQEAVVAALSPHFEVAAGAVQTVRRARLDTFDGRLRSAGLLLEQRTSASSVQLVLKLTEAGQSVVAETADPSWPALVEALPAGPVRDAVAPVAGIRALMVISDEKRRVRRIDLRNKDQKVVARLELAEPVAASSAPAELTVHELRGYADQARRAATLLNAIGLREVESEDDRGGGSAAHAVDRDAPATLLLSAVFSDFLAAMRNNLPGLLDDVDTEFLHDFRVAVRRTRSTLKLGRPALPDSMRSRWEPEFKWLGDLTTPVRDLDVYELDLPTMAEWLVAANGTDLEPFAKHLRRRRTAERRTLVRGLKSARFERLLAEWEEALSALTAPQPASDEPQPTAGELAGASIDRAYARVAGGGSAISADSPAEELHTLRKRCKELRYALEVFAPVIDKQSRKRAVSELKELQDVLGRFQDTEVQRHAMRDFAAEMMVDGNAGALLAMGELIGHLDTEQNRARAEFEGVFDHFVRPSNARRMHRLGSAG